MWSLLVALLAAALAGPETLTHQGRVLEAGVPLEGEHSVTIALHDTPTGGAALWTETLTPTFEGGYFSVRLGETEALPEGLFDGSARVMPSSKTSLTASSLNSGV